MASAGSCVAVRVAHRILAMAVAIWHSHKTDQPVIRSLMAYGHRSHRNDSSRREAPRGTLT